jgi:hypothetical protein
MLASVVLALVSKLSTLDSIGDARMHTVELLDEAVQTAKSLGYDVRQDWLGGNGGGHCLVRGRKWILLDVAQSAEERLAVVTDALRDETGVAKVVKSPELMQRMQLRRAA